MTGGDYKIEDSISVEEVIGEDGRQKVEEIICLMIVDELCE
jgi:hypothetical protein